MPAAGTALYRLEKNYCAEHRGIGGIDVAEDLRSCGLDQLLVAADIELRALLLSLIAIENPQRKSHADPEVCVDRRIAPEIEADGRIGRSIRQCEAVIGVGFVYGLLPLLLNPAGCPALIGGFVQCGNLLREVVWPGDIELVNRRSIVEQCKQLESSQSASSRPRFASRTRTVSAAVRDGRVDPCNPSDSVTVATDVQYLVVIGQVLLCQIQDGLFLERLHEGHAQIEDQRSLQVRLARHGDLGRLLRALQPQLAFVLALKQVASTSDREKIGEWAVRRATIEWIDLVGNQGQSWDWDGDRRWSLVRETPRRRFVRLEAWGWWRGIYP